MRLKNLLKELLLYQETLDITQKEIFNRIIVLLIKNLSLKENEKYHVIINVLINNKTFYKNLAHFNKCVLFNKKLKEGN